MQHQSLQAGDKAKLRWDESSQIIMGHQQITHQGAIQQAKLCWQCPCDKIVIYLEVCQLSQVFKSPRRQCPCQEIVIDEQLGQFCEVSQPNRE